MTERVTKELNYEGRLEAVLRKLVLHKTGSYYDKHVNVEKEKNTFGTLIIKLPSIYAGGEFVVYDQSKMSKRVYDFDNRSQDAVFNIQYVAHLANLEHELLKVQAGYRLLLVYSLMRKEPISIEGSVTTAGASRVFNMELINDIYSHLLRATYCKKSVSILLENEYVVNEIRANGANVLKGSRKIKLFVENNKYYLRKK